MKIRYPVIAIILILIIEIGFNTMIPFAVSEVLGLLVLVCLGLIVYLLLRNLFRVIKGQVTKQARSGAETDILRSEVERLSKRVEELEKDR